MQQSDRMLVKMKELNATNTKFQSKIETLMGELAEAKEGGGAATAELQTKLQGAPIHCQPFCTSRSVMANGLLSLDVAAHSVAPPSPALPSLVSYRTSVARCSTCPPSTRSSRLAFAIVSAYALQYTPACPRTQRNTTALMLRRSLTMSSTIALLCRSLSSSSFPALHTVSMSRICYVMLCYVRLFRS